jgi:hypothetical protein
VYVVLNWERRLIVAQSTFEFRIPFQRLLTGLLVTVLPLSLAGLLSITQSERSLERTIGGYFKTMATATAAEVSHYVNDRVIRVAEISLEPALVEAARAANNSYRGLSDAAVSARIQEIEKNWNSPSSQPLVQEILGSKASQLLRRYRTLDQRFLRITVTDERGATIAGTHKTLDYYQADEEYWQNIFAAGRGAVSVTDILFDEATNSHYIGIGVPIREEESQRVIGTVDALMDVSTLLPLVNRHEIGTTGRNLLVKADGTVIAGPQVTISQQLPSEEYRAVQDALGTLSGRQTGFLVADLPKSGRTLIGFADTGLRDAYPKLALVLLVAQDARQAFAPVRVVSRWLGFICVVGLLMVTLLAVYYAVHRPYRLAGIDELRAGRQAPAPELETVHETPDAEKQPQSR